jgi:hypothetical protein
MTSFWNVRLDTSVSFENGNRLSGELMGVIQNGCRETGSRMVPIDKGLGEGDSWRSPRPGGSKASLNYFYRGC